MQNIWKKLFIDVKKGRLLSLVLLRTALYVLLVLLWVFVHDLNKPLPNLAEATIYQGTLVDTKLPRRGAERTIIVHVPEERVLTPAIYTNWERIVGSVGKQVKVWVIRGSNIYLIPQDVYVELEVDGEAMVNWGERRQELMDKRPGNTKACYSIIALFMVVVSLIFRINRTEN